jgi:hypothetical protein
VAVSKSAIVLILVAIGCASAHRAAPLSPFADYRRFFLTMPSHSAGFGMTAWVAPDGRTGHGAGPAGSTRPASSTPPAGTSPAGAPPAGTSPAGSTSNVVDRALVALQGELTEAGFDVVGCDQDADAVLEITMGGVRPGGEADRAFIAFRDAESGRLLAAFSAEARAAPATVETLMARIAALIEETVEEPPPGNTFR